MQINRLFEIVYLLIGGKTLTAKELASHFEVSPRTILRDIDVLSSAGVPVYAAQGRGGGISIHENFVLNKAVISRDEQNQILFALQSLSAAQYSDAEEVLKKLQALFESTADQWIEVDFSRWGNYGSDKEKFGALRDAILMKRAICFTYSSAYGVTDQRKVYPLKLTFKSKSWYLQAYCTKKGEFRTFKINRMREVRPLEEVFSIEADTLPEMDPVFPAEENLIDVMLLFKPYMAYRVYDEFDDGDIIKNPDGSLLVKIKMPDGPWLYDYVLSMGDAAEVLTPQSVRTGVAHRADAIKKLYEDKT